MSIHARTTDPRTSHDAAASIKTMDSFCAALLRTFTRGDWTAEEAGQLAHIDPWAASKRVSDLRRRDLIEPVTADGKVVTRRNQSGRSAMVCTITPAGYRRLMESPAA